MTHHTWHVLLQSENEFESGGITNIINAILHLYISGKCVLLLLFDKETMEDHGSVSSNKILLFVNNFEKFSYCTD